jgi:hypothetical protein
MLLLLLLLPLTPHSLTPLCCPLLIFTGSLLAAAFGSPCRSSSQRHRSSFRNNTASALLVVPLCLLSIALSHAVGECAWSGLMYSYRQFALDLPS